ncbi:MAG TPA: hypothetical protein VGM10_10850 [Actinocrinis sp.]|jgi:hypothetical protein
MSHNAAFAGAIPGSPAACAAGPGAAAGAELERWYTEVRGWPVERRETSDLWLPAGSRFDALEAPEEAGRRALRRLLGYGQAALAPGPVGLTGAGGCVFFVAPGARDDLPELLDWLDWGGIDLGLRAYGEGDRLPAPRRDQWLHDPLGAVPEVIALLATIAQACSTHRLGRRGWPA